MSKALQAVAVCVALFSSLSATAQLIVDRAGARDILFKSDTVQLEAESRFRFTFDSDEKSFALGYFNKEIEVFNGTLIAGLRPKVAATDGWEQFFRFDRVPGIEVAGFVNWSPNQPADVFYPFVNLRLAYQREEIVLFDSAKPLDSQIEESALNGASAYLSGGAIFAIGNTPGQHGFALSAGFERTSNYKDLKRVEIRDVSEVIALPGGGQRIVSGDATAARVGKFEEFNAFPLDFTYTYEIPITGLVDKIDRVIPLIPELEYYTIFAPYGEFRPRDKGKPDHALGLQFTLKTISGDDTFENINKKKLAYPISVFVECRNVFRSESDVAAGIATIFTY